MYFRVRIHDSLLFLCRSYQLFMATMNKFWFRKSVITEAWIHVVIVVKGTKAVERLSVYHDGVLEGSTTKLRSSGYGQIKEPTLKLGHETADVALDELIIWLEELTAAQIYDLYMSY